VEQQEGRGLVLTRHPRRECVARCVPV
jgi:hypothetical protein